MTVTVRAISILLDKMFKAHNFRAGPQWAPSVIVERLGPLTYLVQVNSGVFRQCHIDYLHMASDNPFNQNDSSNEAKIRFSIRFHSYCQTRTF